MKKKFSTWENTVKIEQVIVNTLTKSFSTKSFDTDLKNKPIIIQ